MVTCESTKVPFHVWFPATEILISDKGVHIIPFKQDFPFELKFFQFLFNHRVTPSFHDYLEVTYIYQGRGTFHIENTSYQTMEDDIFVVGNNRFHRLEADPESGVKVICCFFLPEFVYRTGSNILDYEYINFFHDSGSYLSNRIPAEEFKGQKVLDLIHDMYLELTEKNFGYQLAVKNHLLEILLLISRFYKTKVGNPANHQKKRVVIKKLEGAFRFIEEHYKEKVTLKDLAAQVFMSPSHFCKVFKNATGCTSNEYLFRLRIDKAKELLMNSDLTITQIAYEIGFESHSYFDRIFHRFTNTTPKDFRDNNGYKDRLRSIQKY